MSKKCLICWVTCTSCRGWSCRCWMASVQVLQSNQLIEQNSIPAWDYRRLWIVDMIVSWVWFDEINQNLINWLMWDEQVKYAPKAWARVIAESNKCKYDWMWVWSRCTKCWVARRDKQHDLSKVCIWTDSTQT